MYLLIHMHTSGAGQASIERWCLLIDHLAPRNIRFVLHVCDCGHWDQIVSTTGYHIEMIWVGSNFAMMSARTYASTVMQRAGLSVENPVAGLPYGKEMIPDTKYFRNGMTHSMR